MKVTPHTKKFGRYAEVQVIELPDRAAKLLIKVGKLEAAGLQSELKPEPEPEIELEASQPEAADTAEPQAAAVENADQVEPQPELEPEPQAETATPELETAVQTKVMEPAAAPEPRAKRQYNRRDMTAEGSKTAPAKKAARKAASKRAEAKG